jgi:hypothetical protein
MEIIILLGSESLSLSLKDYFLITKSCLDTGEIHGEISSRKNGLFQHNVIRGGK